MLALFGFLLLLSTPSFSQTGCSGLETHTVAFASDRAATVWHPAGLSDCGRLPLVVFSHGDHGCSTQSLFFTEALARRGYIVVAPNHLDAHCDGDAQPPSPSEQSFAKPENWTPDTYSSRRDDLRSVLDFVLANPTLAPHVDVARIGGAGHSLGGYSMMAMAGAWPSWTDARYRAILLFSPYSTPFLTQGTVGQIRIPVMYQGGQLDIGITPYVSKPGGVYDSSNPTKYFVEFYGAGHLAWTNASAQDRSAKQINDYGIAFLDEYLKGEPQRLLNAKRQPQVADYRSER